MSSLIAFNWHSTSACYLPRALTARPVAWRVACSFTSYSEAAFTLSCFHLNKRLARSCAFESMTSRWPIWLWDFSYCRFNVIALWTCERMQFIAGLFRLEAKEPRLHPAFGAVGPFNEIGMQGARLICSHSNSLTGGSALASLSHRRLAPSRADDALMWGVRHS